jgi:hypothetical protein
VIDAEESVWKAMSQIRKKNSISVVNKISNYSFDRKNLNRAFNHQGAGEREGINYLQNRLSSAILVSLRRTCCG